MVLREHLDGKPVRFFVIVDVEWDKKISPLHHPVIEKKSHVPKLVGNMRAKRKVVHGSISVDREFRILYMHQQPYLILSAAFQEQFCY
jgi:hypothetical protein